MVYQQRQQLRLCRRREREAETAAVGQGHVPRFREEGPAPRPHQIFHCVSFEDFRRNYRGFLRVK